MWEPGAAVLDGRFRVVRALGKGSATEVYAAEQVSLARSVVLKVIRPELGVAEGLGERFANEVRRLAQVDHPAVVRVIDSGQVEKLLYLVTELVEGAPLAQELKGEPMMPERALALLTQLAEGLAAVHEKGLVHGDLRPESVVLVKTARGEQVKLTDFGIARLVDAENPHERVTVMTRAIGPAEYFSPEQARGAQAGPASDVYAFGVLAYQVLSGRLPFAGPSATELLQQHQHATPEPLLKVAGHLADQFRLCELVMRCLEKDPKARPPSASQLAGKLTSLPKPAEPTLFVEAMQRPPELPPSKPKAPPELMPSVQVPVLTPPPTPDASSTAPMPKVAASPMRRWPLVVGAVAVLGIIAGVAMVVSGGGAAAEARKLIEMRQPAQALEVIGKAQRKASGPQPDLMALKVAALHLAHDHSGEASAFKALGPATREARDPLVLGGLVEDFGEREDAALKALLEQVPKIELKAVLERFAKEPLSPRQWGALRWLDLQNEASALKLVELYAISLESNACAVRKVAAKRLEQLDDDAAEDELMRLRETPREGADKNCGQDEAAAALQWIRRQR